jgi:hypothetical protein
MFKKKRVKLSSEEYLRQRIEIFARQGWRCANCGRLLQLQRDHIVKRSQGGGDEPLNAQGLCPRCHEEKDNLPKSKSDYWKKKVLTSNPPGTIVVPENAYSGGEAELDRVSSEPSIKEAGGGVVPTFPLQIPTPKPPSKT